MADGRTRSGPQEDSSFSGRDNESPPPQYLDERRRNMVKCIAAVLIVLGRITTAGATSHDPRTRRPTYEPHRVSWAKLREDLHRAKLFGERALNNTYIPLYVVPGIRVPCTAIYEVHVSISRRHFLQPATRTGTFSALGWDRLPSTAAAYSLCKA